MSETEFSGFLSVSDNHLLFVYNYIPKKDYKATIFIISGINGINHFQDMDIIKLLSNSENRVVAIHPRGTGYSEGLRGDISSIERFIEDYLEIIRTDRDYLTNNRDIFLFGYCMSCAFLLAVAYKLGKTSGIILVDPPYLKNNSKKLSPSFRQNLKYTIYQIFARHKPIAKISDVLNNNIDERFENEAVQQSKNSLSANCYSIHYIIEMRELIKKIPLYADKIDCSLLLIYGLKDSLVLKQGCDLIFKEWKHQNKQYIIVKNGMHGKLTVKLTEEIIVKWMQDTFNSNNLKTRIYYAFN